jgi:cobalt/nickel transport system permease protein
MVEIMAGRTAPASVGLSLQTLDGRVKTLLGITAIVVVVSLRHWYLAAGPLLVVMALLLRSGISFPKLLLRLVAPFSIAWLVLLSLLFTYGHTEIGSLTLFRWVLPMYQEGLSSGLLIMLRLLAAVSIITLLSFTTPMPEILATLRLVRIPNLMIDLSEMIYRYITLMDSSLHTMRRAQLSRGGGSLPWYGQTRDLGVIAGVMMLKSLDRSTNIYKAMLSRGFEENSASPPYFEHAVPGRHLAAGGLCLLAILALLALDLVLR